MKVSQGVLGRRLPLRLMGVFGLFFFLTLYAYIYVPAIFPSRAQRSNASAISGSAADTTLSVTKCANELRPNLILTAIDAPKWQDQIFIFCQSLDLALGRDALLSVQQHDRCPPAPVIVKIITTPQIALNPPKAFKVLMKRYPFLEFVGTLSEDEKVNIALRRFKGLSDVLGSTASAAKTFNNILVCDLDIAFQRNPFTLPMKQGVGLLYFGEWRGMKIGQCGVHMRWFAGCMKTPGTPYVTEEQLAFYAPLDRICAGSTYGTAGAISVYLQMMADELFKSNYQCNDQALHIHLFYSGLLEARLMEAGVGRPWLVPNEEALFGTVGSTPFVAFNEWGEILNEVGEVQVGIHQYKVHQALTAIVRKRYGWMADVANSKVPPIPVLQEENDDVLKNGTDQTLDDSPKQPQHIPRYRLDASPEACKVESSLCSCKFKNCQFNYEAFT